MGSFPRQKYQEGRYFDFVQTTASAWPNQLFNLRLPKQNPDLVLSFMEEAVQGGRIPSHLMLNPQTTTKFILNSLKQRGYKSNLWTAMNHSLRDLKTVAALADFEPRRVQGQADLRKWLSIVEKELMAGKSLNYELFKFLLAKDNCHLYLGFTGNQALATALLYHEHQRAGVYLVSTKKEARRQGFGIRMTNWCLIKAQSLACEGVDLQAREQGVGIYKSLGFKPMGEIHHFRINRPALR